MKLLFELVPILSRMLDEVGIENFTLMKTSPRASRKKITSGSVEE